MQERHNRIQKNVIIQFKGFLKKGLAYLDDNSKIYLNGIRNFYSFIPIV